MARWPPRTTASPLTLSQDRAFILWGIAETDLLDRLAADDRLPLDRAALDALLADPGVFVGTAGSQVQAVVERIGEVVAARPTAAAYDPEPIL